MARLQQPPAAQTTAQPPAAQRTAPLQAAPWQARVQHPQLQLAVCGHPSSSHISSSHHSRLQPVLQETRSQTKTQKQMTRLQEGARLRTLPRLPGSRTAAGLCPVAARGARPASASSGARACCPTSSGETCAQDWLLPETSQLSSFACTSTQGSGACCGRAASHVMPGCRLSSSRQHVLAHM